MTQAFHDEHPQLDQRVRVHHAVNRRPRPSTTNRHRPTWGCPCRNGKLAMWLFLVTEIMFFTALIGVYVILRNGTPNHSPFHWPAPHEVHLVEWIGALNTFVLICSSLTVVLAHHAAHVGKPGQAMIYVGVTLALGGLFLGIKAYEYTPKFDHDIIPGRIGEVLPGTMEPPDGLNKRADGRVALNDAFKRETAVPRRRDAVRRTGARQPQRRSTADGKPTPSTARTSANNAAGRSRSATPCSRETERRQANADGSYKRPLPPERGRRDGQRDPAPATRRARPPRRRPSRSATCGRRATSP